MARSAKQARKKKQKKRNATEVIELLDDDENDKKQKSTTPKDGDEEVIVEDEAEEEEEDLVALGTCDMTIVGIRYYSGVAYPGEYVDLVREPHNPYDRNAIRVENMHGQKVGHIKREMAAALAPLMDNGENNHRIFGTIPRRGNAYTIPVQVELYHARIGQQDEEGHAAAMEALMRDLQTRLRLFSFTPGSTCAEAAAVADNNKAIVEKKVLDWKTQQQELDEMFDKQMKEQCSNMPDLPKFQLLTSGQAFKESVKLFPYQKHGIQWMVLQEEPHDVDKKNPFLFYKQIKEKSQTVWFCDITNCSQTQPPKRVKGGILADEMGLGKTLQTIGLILLNPPEDQGNYHERTTKAQPMEAAAAAPKSIVSVPPKITKPICTLIVCPVTIMSTWTQQIESHVKPGLLNVAIYQGPNRAATIIPKLEYNEIDVLIVSYHTLAADYAARNPPQDKDGKKAPKRRRKSNMKSILDLPFHRVILDEAHTIRSSKTNLFKSVVSVQADRKFALTGTPFINRADDIYSLLSFLGMEPINDHNIFKRAITLPIQNGNDIGLTRLRTIMSHVALRRTKTLVWDDIQQHTTKKVVELRSVSFPEDAASIHKEIYDTLFNTAKMIFQAILQQQKQDDNNNGNKINYFSIVEILLRIRQACCNAALMVPKERLDCANAIAKQLKERMEDKENQVAITPEEGKVLLQKLLGTFQPNQENENECSICLCEMDEGTAVILRTCSHVFCEPCISRVIATDNAHSSRNKSSKCPLCRNAFSKNDMIQKKVLTEAAAKQTEDQKEGSEDEKKAPVPTKDIDIDENDMADDGENMEAIVSPKVQALLDGIEEMQPDEKGVIFSQFTKFLDIIGKALKRKGHKFTRIDGSMTAQRRSQAIGDFNADDDDGGTKPRFILCSLHAAGTGINLTRGNVVFMMDCWWNQAAENQAMDRIHRIGQTRDVRIIRFVMKDSIEEKMMIKMQESKAMLGKGAMEKLTAEEKRKTKMTLIRDLFCV